MEQAIKDSSPEVAVITGAGRGIGKAIAFALASKGIYVLCVSQSNNSVQTAEAIRAAGGRADSIAVDLGNFTLAEKLISQWIAEHDYSRYVTILAAATLGPSGTLLETNLEEWNAAIRINVLGNLAVTRAVLKRQMEARYGRILFFAGGGAAYAYPIFPAYAATKTALVRVVENLAEDVKEAGDISVAILAPGAVETDTLASVRSHGGYVKTTVSMDEPVRFATEFALSSSCAFSGGFVHVRDVWPEYLNQTSELPKKDLWKLRRVE